MSVFPVVEHWLGNVAYVQLAETLAGYLSTDAGQEIERLREAWREGHSSNARVGIQKLLQPDRWRVLQPTIQASVLRFRAQLALDAEDFKSAEAYAAEAAKLDPEENARLEALIHRASGRLDAAVARVESRHDPDSVSLRAALMLEGGRVIEAMQTLDEIPDHPEAHRIRALAYLLQRDTARALLEIGRGTFLRPRWRAMKYARAVIQYFAGLSPCATPTRLTQWPEPVDWTLVKINEAGCESFRLAAEGFADLASVQEISDEERRILEAWRLASLANDIDRRVEAESLARRLLSTDPGHFRVMAWVLVRRLEVELGGPIKRIQERIASSTASVPEIISLCIWFVQNGSLSRAAEELDRTRGLFFESGMGPIWRLWRTQVAAMGGNGSQFNDVEEGYEGELARIMLLRSEALKTGDWTALIRVLRQQAATDDVRLLELCKVLAERGEWPEAAELAPSLVKRIGTAEALSLASVCLYNGRQYEQCLELLETHRDLYPHSELPAEMQRLRITLQRELGIVQDATARAEELLANEPSKRSYLMLSALYFEKGDFKALALLLRRHTRFSDLTAPDLLLLSMRVLDEDPVVASELWHRAAELGFSANQLTAALDVAYKLGLDAEVGPIIERLAALANDQDGPIRRFTLHEAVELLKGQRDDQGKLYDAYLEGRIPVHLLSQNIGLPLVVLYHRLPGMNEAFGAGTKPSALIRHGSHTGGRIPPVGHTRLCLHADLTSLLTAAHLGILEKVEECFAPISLPYRTVVALAAMRDGVKPHQPNRVRSMRVVAELIQKNRISVEEITEPTNGWRSDIDVDSYTKRLLHFVKNQDWILATSLPFLGEDGSPSTKSLPPDYEAVVRDGHAVADSLRLLGEISEEEHTRVLRMMGPRPFAPANQGIEKQSKVLCRSSVLEALGKANVLGIAASVFRLSIETEEFGHLSAEIESMSLAESDAAWLTGIIEHLGRGITEGKYHLLPDLERNQETSLDESAVKNPMVKCLLDLVRFIAKDGDVLWIDDRYLGGFVHKDGALIVDTVDLLYALRERQMLSSAEFTQLLRRVRQNDFRFVALDGNEIKAAILDGVIAEGRLTGTKTLRVLRSYYARCLLSAHVLRVTLFNTAGENSSVEWPFLFRSGQAVTDSILELWRQAKSDSELARARSEWILRNLYLPDRGRSFSNAPHTPELDRQLEAVTLSALLGGAITFSIADGAERDARRGYLEWVYLRLVQRRFGADPLLATATLDLLKRLLQVPAEAAADSALHRRTGSLLANAFLADLPAELNERIVKDGDFLAKVGVSPREVLNLAGHVIAADQIWRAATQVFKTNEELTITSDDGFELELSIKENDSRRELVLNDSKKGYRYALLSEGLGVLSDSSRDREEALRCVPHWFDRSALDLDHAIATIAVIDDPAKRMSQLIQLRRRSAEQHYIDLDIQLRHEQKLTAADFVPVDPSSILRYLRFSGDVESVHDIGTAVEQAAQQSIIDLGVEATFIRFSGLPIQLPSCIFSALASLSAPERLKLIKQFLRAVSVSPLGAVHCAKILATFSEDRPSYRRLFRLILRRNLGPSSHIEAWLTVVRRCSEDLCFVEAFRKMSVIERFVILWAHADRLYRVLRNLGVQAEWIEENIEATGPRLPAEAVFADPDYIADVAYPGRLDKSLVALSNVSFLLAGEGELLGSSRQTVSQLLTEDSPMMMGLLRDLARAPNALGSYLGSFQHCLELLPDSLRETFSLAAAHVGLRGALEQVKGGQSDLATWLWVHGVLGDREPPSELVSAMREAMLATDFKELYDRMEEHRVLPILVASMQAIHLGSDVALHVRSQLIRLTMHIAGREQSPEACERDQQLLLESAFKIANALRGPESRFLELASLMDELLTAWPRLGEKLDIAVRQLVEGLPTAASACFWRIQVRLRASGGSGVGIGQ